MEKYYAGDLSAEGWSDIWRVGNGQHIKYLE
jgi:hypothetical protein